MEESVGKCPQGFRLPTCKLQIHVKYWTSAAHMFAMTPLPLSWIMLWIMLYEFDWICFFCGFIKKCPPPTWGDNPIWLIFFKWVESTNYVCGRLPATPPNHAMRSPTCLRKLAGNPSKCHPFERVSSSMKTQQHNLQFVRVYSTHMSLGV